MSVSFEQLSELTIGLLPRLRRFAHAISEPLHSADDLVQHCIERALLERAQWRSGQELESGLFGMIARACLTGSHLTPASVQLQQPGEPSELRRAYASLPLQQRIAIALVVLEQRSYHDTAVVLDLPLPVLTQQLWQGREQLHAQLPQ